MYETIIIGSGPAAHMASVYLHTSNIKQIIINKITSSTYDFTGHDKVVGVLNIESPTQLIEAMDKQIKNFGIESKNENIEKILFSEQIEIKTETSVYQAKTVIIDDLSIFEKCFRNEKDFEKLKKRGVFVCGRVNSKHNEAIILIGSGCQSFFDAKDFLNEIENKEIKI